MTYHTLGRAEGSATGAPAAGSTGAASTAPSEALGTSGCCSRSDIASISRLLTNQSQQVLDQLRKHKVGQTQRDAHGDRDPDNDEAQIAGRFETGPRHLGDLSTRIPN